MSEEKNYGLEQFGDLSSELGGRWSRDQVSELLAKSPSHFTKVPGKAKPGLKQRAEKGRLVVVGTLKRSY